MSHGDAVHERAGRVPACSRRPSGSPVAAFEDRERRLYGMQWHPEVKHSPLGQRALENFLYLGAGLSPDLDRRATWSPTRSRRSASQVGDARVICGLSGGVDSAVAAALVQRPSATS